MPEPFTGAGDSTRSLAGAWDTTPTASSQDVPLLQTKLYIPPPRAEWVSRPRLLARLDEALDCKLTLISAPAGFGKTTLLGDWARSAPDRQATPVEIAWLSLDSGDNDPARFWSYIIAALQTIPRHRQAGLGDTALALLHASKPASFEAILTGLINDITGDDQHTEDGPPAILILDDFHLIDEPQIHQALPFLLDNLPASPQRLHLVISGRSDPPWPLARWRARRDLVELRTPDLRFTPEEAAAFLNDAMNLALSPADVAALEARTEGWIAGLQMAALAMRPLTAQRETTAGQRTRNLAAFVQAFSASHRFVLDYLVEEILEQQPAQIQDFLLRTSILDRLTAPLCDTLLEHKPERDQPQSRGQQTLEHLESSNLFLVPLDDERRWYRYYHLFADLLRNRLAQQADPAELTRLHGRASAWYERHGLLAEAVMHALQSSDVDRVARLVEGNAMALVHTGGFATLECWLDALPAEVLQARPWLSVAQAWGLMYTGRFDAVERLLDELEGVPHISVHDAAHDATHIAGHIAAIRAYIAEIHADPPASIDFAREALACLPAADLQTRGFAALTLGVSLRINADYEEAGPVLVEAVAIGRAAGNSHQVVAALCDLAELHRNLGRLRQAMATCQEALHVVEGYRQQSGRRLPIAAHAYGRMSRLFYEWNDLQDARRYAEEGRALSRRSGLAEFLTDNTLYLACVLRVCDDVEGALELIQQARKIARGLSPWYLRLILALEAETRLIGGDVSAAGRWAAETRWNLDSLANHTFFELFPLAKVWLAQGRLQETWDLLERMLARAERVGGMDWAVRVLGLQAVVHQALGQGESALAVLKRALSIAELEGHVRSFVDLEAPMAGLLQQAVSHGLSPDYAAGLLTAFGESCRSDQPLAPQALASTVAVQPLIEPLTERERQVLRLLDTSLPGPEIAQQLVISPSTYRTHTKNIYGKLGVHSRIEALARARKLDLL